MAAQYHTARFRLMPHLAKALSVPVPPLRKPGSAWAELPRPAAAGMVSAGHVRIGYARAPTVRQSLDTQVDSLRPSGVTRIFSEKISTRAVTRPELDRAVASTPVTGDGHAHAARARQEGRYRETLIERFLQRLGPDLRRHSDVSISWHPPRPPRCLRRYHSMLVARKLARRCYNAIEPGPTRGPAAGLRRSSMRSLGVFSERQRLMDGEAMSVSKRRGTGRLGLPRQVLPCQAGHG